jgi:mono/diheme cytochrome c family protein
MVECPADKIIERIICMAVNKLFCILLLTIPLAFAAGADPPSFPEARKLVNTQGCKACHRLDNEGGDYARPLGKMSRRQHRDRLQEMLVQGTTTDDGRYMPSYSYLQKKEIEMLVNYLKSFK